MKNRILVSVMAAVCAWGLCACASNEVTDAGKAEIAAEESVENENALEAAEEADEKVQLQVFIAASLSKVMDEIAQEYNASHPDVEIIYNADSSGTLMTQIEEGYSCDIFFSAAQKQMNRLEEDGLLIDGTRVNVLNNQLVVVALNDSETKVTGLDNLECAESIAMADGSVPAGKYTRSALMKLGKLEGKEDAAEYTTQEVSEALGNVEISEQGNVSKVLAAVAEGSCEVGTVYYSDTYGYEDKLQIIEMVDSELTGDIIYPIAQVKNDDASQAEIDAAEDFISFVTSDTVKQIFESYRFDIAGK